MAIGNFAIPHIFDWLQLMGSLARVPGLVVGLEGAPVQNPLCNHSLLNYRLTQNRTSARCHVIRGKMKRLDKRMTNLVILLPRACGVFAHLPCVKFLKYFLPRYRYWMTFYGVSTFFKILDLRCEQHKCTQRLSRIL